MDSAADMIAARLAEIEVRIGQQELAIRAMREERDELLTAVRVFRRFSGSELDILAANVLEERKKVMSASLDEVAKIEQQERAQQRAGMTTPQMILEILADHPVMSSRDLLAEVQKRYWADAPSSSVAPTAWRMWKDGRLAKSEDGYSLPNRERPVAGATGLLERDDTAGSGSLL